MEYLIIALEGAVATIIAHIAVRRFFPAFSLPDALTFRDRRERKSLILLVASMAAVWLALHLIVKMIVQQ